VSTRIIRPRCIKRVRSRRIRSRALTAFVAVSLLFGPSLNAKDDPEWKSATVRYVRYVSENMGGPVAQTDVGARGAPGGGFESTLAGELDLDTGDLVYTAEERVSIRSRLRLSPGDTVQVALSKGKLLLKHGKGKTRTMKLKATYAKAEYQPRR
jgi:hypothetical protein